MRRDLLEHSITVMERIAEAELYFDMSAFFHYSYSKTECATASCWAGYLCFDPVFKAEGLTIDKSPLMVPRYKYHSGYEAMTALLDINHGATLHIANPGYYDVHGDDIAITPQMVIEHIRDVIAANGACPDNARDYTQDEDDEYTDDSDSDYDDTVSDT